MSNKSIKGFNSTYYILIFNNRFSKNNQTNNNFVFTEISDHETSFYF